MTTSAPISTPQPGALIGGKYRLDELLGKGGMATVHRAVNVATGRKVAVKLMAVRADEDPEHTTELVARFQREARLAGTVETQHIVRVYDAGIDDASGAPYMVMELLDGEDLNAFIKRTGPLRPTLALRVVAQACLGLMKAHEAGVIHRDIKPSNLFLARDEFGKIVVKVLDFGIAKAGEGERLDAADSKTLTQTGVMLGSPHYMSPEQVISPKALDHRTDIWSMGIVLFKCLTGRTPHDEHDTVGQLMVAIVSSAPSSPQNFAPWIPPEIATIVFKALQTQPERRYATVGAMLAEIERHLPEGWDLEPDMFSPMSDRERGSVRPRRSSQPGAAPPETVAPASQRQRRPANDDVVTQAAVDIDTQLSSTQPPPPTPDARSRTLRSSLAVAGGLVLVVSVGGLAAWGLSSPGSTNTGPSRSGAEPSRTASPTTETPTTPATLATGEPSPAAMPLTSVSVAVVPPTATVEVDGAVAVVTAGAIQFSGEPGSVHKVKVRSGSRESTTEVVITANGPRPSSIALGAPARPAARKEPSTASSPTKPKSTTELDQEFK